MEKAEKVANEIARVLPLLQGDHIVPKNAYEKALCKQLNWEVFDNRYYDAFNGESYIEIKKGQSGMHFDMVRYAELLLGHGPPDTLTVFFRWKKKEKQITEAYVIDTKVLIEFLRIDKRYALLYLQVKAQVPRGVNILASATAKDLRMISAFRVDSSGVHKKVLPLEHLPKSLRRRAWTQQRIQKFLEQKRRSKNKKSILYYLF
tara:strand:+ start:1701 stop:2312 length:612 start_codon:yes stop_codon:yes gene_type:complete